MYRLFSRWFSSAPTAPTPMGILLNIARRKSRWRDGVLFEYEHMSSNEVGLAGEQFLTRVCAESGIAVQNHAQRQVDDGPYDLKILGNRVEVKTARMNSEGAYTHHNLRNTGCEYYAFIDIHPDHTHLTIIPKFDLGKQCVITGVLPKVSTVSYTHLTLPTTPYV